MAYHAAKQKEAISDDGGEPEKATEEDAEHTDQTKGHIRDAHFILERTAWLPTVALYPEKFQEFFSSMAQTSGLNQDHLMIMDQAYVLIRDCDHEYLLAFSCKCCCFLVGMITCIETLNTPGMNTFRYNALRIRRISEADLRREG